MTDKEQVKCPECGYQNPAAANKCVICEAYLPRWDERNGSLQSQIICPQCHEPNPRNSSHCYSCGTRLTEHSSDRSDDMDETHSLINKTETQSVTYLDLDRDHPQEVYAVAVPLALEEPVDEIPPGCLKFASWMNLRLDIAGHPTPIIVRPMENKPMLVGRRHESMDTQPQIDLTPYLTERHGVSRRHALLRLRGTRLELQDLNSTNGTTINGVQFAPRESHQVRHQDILRIGQVRIQITFVHQARSAKRGYTEELRL